MSVTTNIDIAKVSIYLVNKAIALGQEKDKNLAGKIYTVMSAVQNYNDGDPTNSYLTQTSNYLFAICGGYAFQAQAILGQGGGGVVINPSTGATNIQSVQTQFVVGDVGSPMTAGETVYAATLIVGSVLLDGTLQISLDQSIMPRNNNNYRSYTYSYAAGILTITFNQAVSNGELYIISYDYLLP